MANIVLKVEIPEQWITRVQEALTNQAGKNIEIQFEGANINYSYEPKGTDNWVQFAERVVREHFKNQIKASELSASHINYREQQAAIEQPGEDVPNDILT